MRRFGVLGDVHCEDLAVVKALRWFAEQRVDRVLCVGDLVDGPGDPARTLEHLQGVDCVRGNHDRWYLAGEARDLPDALAPGTLSREHEAWLRSLPATRSYETAGGRLLLCHGMGDDDMVTLKPDDFGYGLDNNGPVQELVKRAAYRWVVSGHSHQRMVRTIGPVTFVNAGTLFRQHAPCALVLDVVAGTAEFSEL